MDLNPYTCCGVPKYVESYILRTRQVCLVCGTVYLHDGTAIPAGSQVTLDEWRRIANQYKYYDEAMKLVRFYEELDKDIVTHEREDDTT